MIDLLITISLSVLSAGILFRYKQKNMLISILVAIFVSFFVWFYGGKEYLLFSYMAGMLCGAGFIVRRERRLLVDFVMFFCIGGCFYGLWVAFCDALGAVCAEYIVLILFGIFYLLHVPATLLSFEHFLISADWKMEMMNEKKVHYLVIPGIAFGMFLMSIGFLSISVEDLALAIVKWLLMTGVFWLGITVLMLMVAYGKASEQSSAETDYYHSMRRFMNIVRSQRHDYNLHVQTVASLIQQEKWEECRTYVNAITLDAAEMNTVLLVKDPAIAALLHNYRMQAQQRGIEILFDIRDDMTRVVTNVYETNKIIGNLLQNAIDELELLESPGTIELGIYKRGEFCLIRVSNRVRDKKLFMETQKELFEQGFTTKQGHDGIGLSSIQALAKRVGGDVTAWLEDDVAHFIATIPIRITDL